MFQFPGFASCTYVFSAGYPQAGGFPHSEIPGSKPVCRLTRAYRRLPRPSSPLIAKASTMCAFVLDHITPKSLLSLSFYPIASFPYPRSFDYIHGYALSFTRQGPRSQIKILRLNLIRLFIRLLRCPASFVQLHTWVCSLTHSLDASLSNKNSALKLNSSFYPIASLSRLIHSITYMGMLSHSFVGRLALK